jgi:hypothetical protein
VEKDQEEKLRKVWRQMHRRCTVPKDDRYYRYGARGISVCPEWSDWPVFRDWAVSAGYGPGLSIDRIDNDGNYEPGNCQWSTRATQAGNRGGKRANVMLTAFGETKSMIEWSRDSRCPVSYAALSLRVRRRKWEDVRAITTPAIRNNDQATHCPQGHEYTPENIYWDGPDKTWRKCRTCCIDRAQENYLKRKGTAQAG